MVDDFLHDRIPGIWNRADLVSLWKDLPSEPPTEPPADPFDSDELELPSRSELLDGCISQAEEERSAREELRSLLGYLLEEGEDIPEPLSSWVHREYVGRNPPAKRGRPRLVDRDLGIVVAYMSLSHRPVGELTNTGVGAMGLFNMARVTAFVLLALLIASVLVWWFVLR